MKVVYEENLKAHLTVLGSDLHSQHLIINTTSFTQVRLKNNVIMANMPPS